MVTLTIELLIPNLRKKVTVRAASVHFLEKILNSIDLEKSTLLEMTERKQFQASVKTET